MEPIDLFFSYSHKDEELRDKLETHLSMLKREGLINSWHDRKIVAGTEWGNDIDQNLERARIVLLLVSADFLASDYCYDKEMTRALERREKGEAEVIPIILRSCDWSKAPFAKLQALPRDAVAVTTWSNEDQAWTGVAKGIREVIHGIQKKGTS